jgi:hypothetical protein
MFAFLKIKLRIEGNMDDGKMPPSMLPLRADVPSFPKSLLH